MPSLDVFAYRFPDDAASLAAYEAVMRLIAGGSAYRLHTPDGSQPPTLAVFAFANAPQLRATCRAAGGTPTTLAPDLLHDLTVRSLHAAERGIVGKRHHTPGTPAGEALPDDPGDYSPRDAAGESGEGLNASEWLRRERGICSDPDCDQPIAGWCAECDARGAFQAPKLCAAHLMAHCEAAGHTPYLPYPD